jgi:heparan-alpha-glucosaminide N-acetyltransferase
MAFRPNDPPPPPPGKGPAPGAPAPKPAAPPAKPEATAKVVAKPQPGSVSRLRPEPAAKRLVSLDAYRGFIMTLLAAHGFGILALSKTAESSVLWKILDRDAWTRLAFHFNHPAWRSNFLFGPSTDPLEGSAWLRGAVSLWDLIQPAFMFMVGVAMAYSARKRDAEGEPRWKQWLHAFIRAVVLVLLGVFLSSKDTSTTHWEFPNVLAQIGLGYIFVFATVRWRWWGQVAAIATVLIGTWAAFFMHTAPADYNFCFVDASAERGEVLEPPFRQWSKNGNFAHAVDVKLLNELPRLEDKEGKPVPFVRNNGGYQTLNFLPSIATMILGVLCGQILQRPVSPWKRVGFLVGLAALCFVLGMAASVWACPIVKRIWTPSWVLFSGGYVIAMLALFYAVFDALPLGVVAFPLVVVGTNSLLIYLMGQTLTGWTRDKVIHTHFGKGIEWVLGRIADGTGLAAKLGDTMRPPGVVLYELFGPVIDATAVFAVFWLVLYALYRKRIFMRV